MPNHTDIQNEYNYSPLHYAAMNGDNNTMELLLQNGSKIDAKNSYGKTPLHVAAEAGHTEIAKLLIEKGANIHAVNNYGETALHVVARKGDVTTLELLIEKGANIRAVNNYGETALHVAAANGHTEVAKLLIEKGANIYAWTKYVQTPLHIAAQAGHTGIVKLLIEKGVDKSIEIESEIISFNKCYENAKKALTDAINSKISSPDANISSTATKALDLLNEVNKQDDTNPNKKVSFELVQIIEDATSLLNSPTQENIRAFKAKAATAEGHSSRWKKVFGVILIFAGFVLLGISVTASLHTGGFSLFGVAPGKAMLVTGAVLVGATESGIGVASVRLFSSSQQKGLSKAMDGLANTVMRQSEISSTL